MEQRDNTWTLAGIVETEPDFRKTASGRPFCKFQLHVVYRGQVGREERQGDRDAFDYHDYFPVVAWGDACEKCRGLHKGDHIRCGGRLKSRQYKDPKGGVRWFINDLNMSWQAPRSEPQF